MRLEWLETSTAGMAVWGDLFRLCNGFSFWGGEERAASLCLEEKDIFLQALHMFGAVCFFAF